MELGKREICGSVNRDGQDLRITISIRIKKGIRRRKRRLRKNK